MTLDNITVGTSWGGGKGDDHPVVRSEIFRPIARWCSYFEICHVFRPSKYLFIITPTGSHIQIYSKVQLYNKLYLYTIGLHTDKHIMQEHIKGPYSKILQKNIKTMPYKKRNLKKK